MPPLNHPCVSKKVKAPQQTTLESRCDECQRFEYFIQSSDETQDVRPRHVLLGEHALQMQRARTKLKILKH